MVQTIKDQLRRMGVRRHYEAYLTGVDKRIASTYYLQDGTDLIEELILNRALISQGDSSGLLKIIGGTDQIWR